MARKTRTGSTDIVSCLKTVSAALDDIAGASEKLVQQHERLQSLVAELLGIARKAGSASQILRLQTAMQRENAIFTSISNVMKAKHDTAKNAIGNIR